MFNGIQQGSGRKYNQGTWSSPATAKKKKKKKSSQEHNIIIAPIFRLWNTPSICIDKLAWVEIQINVKLLKITSLKLFSKYFAQMCYDTFHTQNLRKKIFHSQIVYCTFFHCSYIHSPVWQAHLINVCITMCATRI